MAEITKKLFAHLDRETERDLMRSELSSQDVEKSLNHIALIYSDYVFSYSKRKIFFISSRHTSVTRKKKFAQLQKLLDIAMDLGVSPEIYIKAQFEQQIGWLRKQGLNHVPFQNLISPKAIERFKEYEARVNGNYSSKEARREEFYSVQTLDVERAVTDSMKKFYQRLAISQMGTMGTMGTVSIDVAIVELEVMMRAKQISNVYVFCSPLSGVGKSEYLDQIFAEMVEKLTAPQKEIAKHTRKEILNSAKFLNEEIRKFI